ncbi:hypothetical protein QFZ63_001075 [Streptomyces sp. B3I7]|uniref:DUF2470 domain-containing protein n=1 Tax=unclassified Streptomyces TaxID=2593676 RepID=UPI002784AE9B|nr:MULTISPECIES: DUF2470 domain-containing protein [unclassified Streptomyces]MDQ0790935.1 hypothetical protein [Streptomyces sp. B3I8]MDQ0809361.1 hypothetical protein [Streptomyces sp. B3I7]
MADPHTWTAAPTAAEHARSVTAVAWSCAVTSEGGKEEFVGAHRVDADGRILLTVPEGSGLLTAAVCAPRGEPSAVLEFADVAPVPVRARIRARLWMAGRLAPWDEHLVFRPTRMVLRRATGAALVDLDEYAAAGPDPLAEAEARLLTHLADCHPAAVERLSLLMEREQLQGAVRVRPLAVDRHGLTLRVERVRDHGDVRLTFHRPADDVTQLSERMHVLLTQAARTCGARSFPRVTENGA